MSSKVRKFTYKTLNVPKTVCNHIIGKEHGQHHRLTVGAVVMVFGVFVAKFPAGHIIGHVLFETVGFLLHCIGAIPLVQIAERIASRTAINETTVDEIMDKEEIEG